MPYLVFTLPSERRIADVQLSKDSGTLRMVRSLIQRPEESVLLNSYMTRAYMDFNTYAYVKQNLQDVCVHKHMR